MRSILGNFITGKLDCSSTQPNYLSAGWRRQPLPNILAALIAKDLRAEPQPGSAALVRKLNRHAQAPWQEESSRPFSQPHFSALRPFPVRSGCQRVTLSFTFAFLSLIASHLPEAPKSGLPEDAYFGSDGESAGAAGALTSTGALPTPSNLRSRVIV